MALSRVKVWIQEVLSFQDLNAEINNILDNALSLISPLTASLDAGSFDITALDELHFTDAAAGASAAGRLRRNGTAITWHDGTAARTVAVGTSSPTFGLVTGAGFTGTGDVAIVPAAAPAGTMTQHGLYRDNVIKGWCKSNFAGAIADAFNVASITDLGVGNTRITWDRDFATADYAVTATVLDTTSAPAYASLVGQAAGSCDVFVQRDGVAFDGQSTLTIAVGDQ